VRLESHLGERRFGDVVVAAPVGGPLGVGELVEEMPIQLARQPGRDVGDGGRVVDEVAAAAFALDERDLGRGGGARHDGDKRHSDQPREVGLGHRGGSA